MVSWLRWRSRSMRADRSAVRLRLRSGIANPRSVANGGLFAAARGGAGLAVFQVGLLARFEPKDGDTTANRLCLQAIVAPTGVDLLREPINTCVVVGVGDLSRQKFAAA